MAALDENGDGEISKAEIEGATAALTGLDKNQDGKLAGEEIRPRGPGGRGPGGPEGPGGPPDRPPGPGPDGGPDGAGFADRMMERLKQADSDGDGKISKDEAPERLQENFDRLDGNADGFLDAEEMRAMAGRYRGRATDRGGNAPDGPPGPPPGPDGAAGPGRGFGSPEGFVDRLFQFDANRDGNLTRDELAKMSEPFAGMGRRGGDRAEGDPPPEGQRRRPQRPDGNNN
jgi:Ca2+-binding EF-hand superfamily protein